MSCCMQTCMYDNMDRCREMVAHTSASPSTVFFFSFRYGVLDQECYQTTSLVQMHLWVWNVTLDAISLITPLPRYLHPRIHTHKVHKQKTFLQELTARLMENGTWWADLSGISDAQAVQRPHSHVNNLLPLQHLHQLRFAHVGVRPVTQAEIVSFTPAIRQQPQCWQHSSISGEEKRGEETRKQQSMSQLTTIKEGEGKKMHSGSGPETRNAISQFPWLLGVNHSDIPFQQQTYPTTRSNKKRRLLPESGLVNATSSGQMYVRKKDCKYITIAEWHTHTCMYTHTHISM